MGYIPTGTEPIQLLPTPWFCLHHWYCSEFTHIPVFVRTAVGKHCTDPHTWLVATSELWYLIHMITLAGLFSTSPSLLVFESVLLLTKIWYTANPTFARKVVVERGGSGLAKVKFLALPPPPSHRIRTQHFWEYVQQDMFKICRYIITWLRFAPGRFKHITWFRSKLGKG